MPRLLAGIVVSLAAATSVARDAAVLAPIADRAGRAVSQLAGADVLPEWHEQPVDVSEVLHLLDDDAHERSRIWRGSADEFRVRGLQCIRTVEVLDHEVLFDLGGLLQEPYEFEIRVVEIPLYRRKPVGLCECTAGARGDSKHGDISKQRAARDALALHMTSVPRS